MFLFETIDPVTPYLPQIQRSVIKHYIKHGKEFMVNLFDTPEWHIDNVDGLKEFLTDLGILEQIDKCFFMVNPPNWTMCCHVDTVTIGRRIALNIPILSCKNSYMAWYDSGVVTHLDYYTGNNFYPEFRPGPEVGRLELVTPTFVRTDIPHLIRNNNNTERVIISLSCKPDLAFSPKYVDEIKKTPDYKFDEFVIGKFYQF